MQILQSIANIFVVLAACILWFYPRSVHVNLIEITLQMREFCSEEFPFSLSEFFH